MPVRDCGRSSVLSRRSRRRRRMLDTTEAASRLTRQPACANASAVALRGYGGTSGAVQLPHGRRESAGD